jgi:XTP/dITP diphosphohydrolase
MALPIQEIVLASHNKGKIREISALLDPFSIKVISAVELGLLEPEETGTTFEENALIKAKTCTELTGKVCLADDSGLVVPALRGAPGVYTADWGGPERDFVKAMTRVHEELEKHGPNADRSCYFLTCLILYFPNGIYHTFYGKIEGKLVWPLRGTQGGFGYDPMFQPNGFEKTMAEMTLEEKLQISHRTQALKELLSYLAESK